MKIATGIISLVLMVVMTIQTMLVGLGAAILSKHNAGASEAVLVIFLYLIAGAFSFAKPVVSMVVFVLAAIIGWAAGGTTAFSDLTVWGCIAFIFAIMSFFSWRSDRKKKKQAEVQASGVQA